MLLRSSMLEVGPAQILIRPTFGVVSFLKDTTTHGLFEPVGLVLLQGVKFIKTADEKQIRNLLNNLKGV